MSNFSKALEFVMFQECPLGDRTKCYTNDPNDRGGATNQGITERAYHAWLASKGRPERPVSEITFEEVDSIYEEQYWIKGNCAALPWPISLYHFDACVNHGVDRAIKLLQASVGVKQDGALGPVTLGAVRALDANLVAFSYVMRRLWFYRRLARSDETQAKFFLGPWTYRLYNLYKELGV